MPKWTLSFGLNIIDDRKFLLRKSSPDQAARTVAVAESLPPQRRDDLVPALVAHTRASRRRLLRALGSQHESVTAAHSRERWDAAVGQSMSLARSAYGGGGTHAAGPHLCSLRRWR